ncbi:MAG TPA: oligosaccharide flippase family protein [Blastocatellia bacterium]|nr:oligosaccharide flippase family protein [Blastocatellia bacterium]
MSQLSTIKDIRPETQTGDVARTAGRGTIYITLAKIWFMVSGYGIHYLLPRLISREEVGLYQVTVSVVSIINAVIITGTYQTVSKYISQEPEKAAAVKSKALKLQTVVGGGASLGFFLLAPVVADYLNDPRLTGYLRLASLITLSYSFYAVFTGYFNGLKKFFAQAALDITYSTLKLAFIIALVWVGLGVEGGIGGFALAAASVLAISAVLAGRGKRAGDVRAADLLKFQGLLLVFTLVLNLLQKVDLMLIKALSSTDPTQTSLNAADYSAAFNVANITYQIIISITFIIFPLVSEATFANDRERTRSYIANTVRYTLMIMALVATLFSANSAEVLSLIYPKEYAGGAPPLRVLAFGMLLFGLLYVLTTIISASGQPKVSLFTGLSALVASAMLNYLLIPPYGLKGAATATTAAMLIGVVAASVYLLSKYRVLIRPVSALRIAGCAGLVYALSIFYAPSSKVLIVAQLVVLSILYLALLLFTRELGRADLAAIRRVLRR